MWVLKGTVRIGIMGNIFTTNNDSDLPEFVEYVSTSNDNYIMENCWASFILENKMTFSLYRKRFILYKDISIKNIKSSNLDGIIRFCMLSFSDWKKCVIDLLPANVKINALSFAFIEKFSVKASESYINEGITSFNYRIFNPDTGKTALIRISKHILVGCGLSGHLIQDVINMCYEKLLDKNEEINSSDVFSFLDGLCGYTLPNEQNFFIQGLAVKIAFILTIITAIESLLIKVLPATYNYLPNLISIVMIYPLWIIFSKIVIFRRRT